MKRGENQRGASSSGPRLSTLFLWANGALALFLVSLVLHASLTVRRAGPALAHTRELVRRLELTDPALFTEASYTRHLSVTDRATPFQDGPLSFEHFPSGGVVAPPPHLTDGGGHGP